MHDFREAYHRFFSQFYNRILVPRPVPIPAYRADRVVLKDDEGRPIPEPDWPMSAWPYITYEIAMPSFTGFTIINVNVWDKNIGNPDYMTRVDDILEQISDAIPAYIGTFIGVCDFGNLKGKLYFQRSNPFIQYLNEPGSKDIQRGIARIMVTNYTL